MNYLAHAYLSFRHSEVLVGNMISDFVKGKKQYNYAAGIQKGIRLHRFIDHFTDTHPATGQLKKFFSPYYRLYSGPFTDIIYDYFLANDQQVFASEAALGSFVAGTYETIEARLDELPAAFQHIFPYMKQYNWLYNYRYREGIQKSFAGMTKRAKFISESNTAFGIFQDNIPAMQVYYKDFFPELEKNSLEKFNELLRTD